MASDKTTNYGWTKIDPEGAVDVATDVNTPLDEIDASLKSVADDTVSTSDLAELETKVANAQSTADSANTAATNAQNTANAANTAATNAQSAADTANTAATNAMTLAETNETDIATLDAEMAGTADSGLKTLITNNTTNISTNTTNISTLNKRMIIPVTLIGNITISADTLLNIFNGIPQLNVTQFSQITVSEPLLSTYTYKVVSVTAKQTTAGSGGVTLTPYSNAIQIPADIAPGNITTFGDGVSTILAYAAYRAAEVVAVDEVTVYLQAV